MKENALWLFSKKEYPAEARASARAPKQDGIWPLSKSIVSQGVTYKRGNKSGNQESDHAGQ